MILNILLNFLIWIMLELKQIMYIHINEMLWWTFFFSEYLIKTVLILWRLFESVSSTVIELQIWAAYQHSKVASSPFVLTADELNCIKSSGLFRLLVCLSWVTFVFICLNVFTTVVSFSEIMHFHNNIGFYKGRDDVWLLGPLMSLYFSPNYE